MQTLESKVIFVPVGAVLQDHLLESAKMPGLCWQTPGHRTLLLEPVEKWNLQNQTPIPIKVTQTGHTLPLVRVLPPPRILRYM